MAVLDRARNVVVLRIVYDGPAEAGKTTTVRALSERLNRVSSSPEEAGERTLYFDWLDYTGGLFEGYQLRCQIVSVPGQRMLAHRRDYLLGTADAIVYVMPATPETLEAGVGALRTLGREAAARRPIGVGVVVQANKQDQAGALPLDTLRDAVTEAGLKLAVIGSTATEGSGVREVFVFAVRLALDRVRELLRLGALTEGAPEIDDAHMLLAQMRANESRMASERPGPLSAPSLADVVGAMVDTKTTPPPAMTDGDASPAERALLEVVQAEDSARAATEESAVEPTLDEPPTPPDGTVASGLVWPPIEGRMFLADATAHAPHLDRHRSGWRASTERGWRFFSPVFALFRDSDEGRGSLIQLARAHSAHGELLSGPRCVVLAPDGHRRWRLWQIVRERLSLRDRLASSLDDKDPSRIARLLVDTANRLVEMDERIRRVANSALRATLDTVGVFAGQTQYVGLVPIGASESASRVSIENELGPVLRDWTSGRGELIVALRRATHGAGEMEIGVMQRLVRLLED